MSNKHNIGDVTTTSLVLTSKVDNLVILKIPMTYINTHTHMLHMSQRERDIYIFSTRHIDAYRCGLGKWIQMGEATSCPWGPHTYIYNDVYYIYILYNYIYNYIYILYNYIYIHIISIPDPYWILYESILSIRSFEETVLTEAFEETDAKVGPWGGPWGPWVFPSIQWGCHGTWEKPVKNHGQMMTNW
jgi:hypothetical protein